MKRNLIILIILFQGINILANPEKNEDSLYTFILSDSKAEYLKGDYTKALKNYHLILFHYKKGSVSKLRQAALLDAGKIYIDTEEDEAAIPYLLESLKIALKNNDSLQTAFTYNSLGSYHNLIKQTDSSIFYYNKALALFSAINNQQGIAGTNSNLANTYFFNQEYDRALFYYKTSLEVASELNIPKDEALYLLNIGAVYKEKKEAKEALIHYKKALSIAHNKNIKLYEMRSANELYHFYKEQKNYKEALYYEEIVNELDNEIFSSNLKQEVSALENRIKITEKSAKINLLTKEKSLDDARLKNQQFLIGILVIALMLVFLLIAYIIKRKNFKQQILREKLEKGKIKGKLRQQELALVKEKSDSKSRELTAVSIMQEKKNELLKNIQELILSYQKSKDENIVNELISKIKDNLRVENDWEVFKLHFEEVHPDFFKKLQDDFPELTQNNLKLCAYIKIGLTNKEIARILAVELDSIKSAKKRLKKKLQIPAGENFTF